MSSRTGSAILFLILVIGGGALAYQHFSSPPTSTLISTSSQQYFSPWHGGKQNARKSVPTLSLGWKESKRDCVPKVKRYDRAIRSAARKHGLQPKLVSAVILVESCGNPNAVSSSDAIGLMQVRAISKADTNLTGNLKNPKDNIRIGTAYLARLEQHYGYKDLDKLLLAYNAGPSAVKSMNWSEMRKRKYPEKVRYAMSLFD